MRNKVLAHQDRFSSEIEIAVLQTTDNKTYLAKPLIFEELPDGMVINESTFTIGKNEAQALMDELWQCGLRPSEGTGSAAALAATQKHLEDMRTLVFKQ